MKVLNPKEYRKYLIEKVSNELDLNDMWPGPSNEDFGKTLNDILNKIDSKYCFEPDGDHHTQKLKLKKTGYENSITDSND